jgi:GNAT superfamily N-acetyltransferase
MFTPNGVADPFQPLSVTSECHRILLEPLLWQLRDEKCAHLWQPLLAASPAADSYRVFLQALEEGRPSTVFTYYTSQDGREEAVGVGTVSARAARYLPEDGISVLGRTYVNPKYRRRSIYSQLLQHRLEQCANHLGERLLGVHIGTSSPRVESVFRSRFPGRVIRIGNENLGTAGVVRALLGITAQLDRQLALPVPKQLIESRRKLESFFSQGADAMSVREARRGLEALKDCQAAYRVLAQFLNSLTDLH